MSKNFKTEIITEAKPHTIKKFELIERYADEWARKILGFNGRNGHKGSKGVVFIDCMCNSGEYRDSDGNVVEGTALRVSKKLNDIISNYPEKEAVLFFNDISEARVHHLQKKIENAGLDNIKVSYASGDCNTFLKNLKLEKYENQYNTLLLYDPYNASIDWDAITPFLNRWGEVIINHMISDTTRGASLAKKQEVIERYEETYQSDIESIIEMGNNKEQLEKIILEIINRKIKTIPNKRYIASFPFFNRTNGLVYNLIHCCANIEGIKLYKKVAWKTFGNKSSTKHTHGPDRQLMLDFDGKGVFETRTDDKCYYVQDIAKYIYGKFSELGIVSLNGIYLDLDEHPIFPSDGYKNDIKTELKNTYGVSFSKDGNVNFPIKKGAV